MENVLAGLFYFVVIGSITAVIIWAIIHGQKQAKQQADAFRRLAERFGGTVENQKWTSRPSARFVHHGANVLVDIYSTGGKHPTFYTQVHVAWPDKKFRCEVYPENAMTLIGKFLGMKDIEINAPEFDKDYHISGNDAEAIRGFLSPGVQRAIADVRQFGGNGQVYLLVNGGTLLVKKLGVYREFEQLARYVVLALELYEQAILSGAKGIEFLDQGLPGTGPPVCQVCGDEILAELVECRACRTPHHRECWSYSGACSTYGCGEIHSIPPAT